MLAFVFTDAGIMASCDASCHFGQIGRRIHVNEKQPLGIAGRDRVCDLMSDSTTTGIHIGVGKVNAVAGTSDLISRLCQYLDRQFHFVKSRMACETAAIACQSAGEPVGSVDTLSLFAGKDLDKSFSI